ncbi:MAG: excinuclease ABC subunit UvrB [Brevinemataceae bacterium]
MKKFEIYSKFDPAGDQPKAITALSENFLSGVKEQTLLGVTGSGKTFTMAGIIQSLQVPTLILSPNKTLAAQLFREFKEFFPENAVEYFVSNFNYYQPEAYLPQKNIYIEKESRINDELDRMRISAVASLLERKDVIIIASISCIYGMSAPEDYKELILLLKVGMHVDLEKIRQHLIRILYEERDFSLERACFRYYDGYLDIHVSYSKDLIRISFDQNSTIESIKILQYSTGNVIEETDRTLIYPARLFLSTDKKIEQAIENIELELIDRLQELRAEGKDEEAVRLEARVKYDIDMMLSMGFCNGIENYSRHLTFRNPGERPFTLLDYFPEGDYLTVIDESHIAVPQIASMFNGNLSRRTTLVNHGFRLPSAIDHRPLTSEEFFDISDKILYVSATPANFELSRSEAVVEQIIRPTGLLDPIISVRQTEGQIVDIIREAKARKNNNERVIVTTLTKRMAENLTEHLIESGLLVSYIHSDVDTITRTEILRDLRLGTFDVLVGINLLREGIDLPEVSLVCILDADKVGFLRSARSLIQIIGRSARNSGGEVIMYADKVSEAMKEAINETQRRRSIQADHNKHNNLTPSTVIKEIKEILERKPKIQESKNSVKIEIKNIIKKEKKDSEKIKKLTALMNHYAEKLLFVEASLCRDEIKKMQNRIKNLKNTSK